MSARRGVFRQFKSSSPQSSVSTLRGASPWVALGTLLATAVASPAAAGVTSEVAHQGQAAGQAATFRFAIPAGPLTTVLADFTKVSGVAVDAADDVARGITSAGVTGTFTAEEALRRLLEGTSLSYTMTGAGSARIDIRTAAETVQVTGHLPRVESPKYATTLSATPQTIQVIPQSVMLEQGTFTLSDTLRNVPGITLQAGEGGGASSTAGDMFNMRGFNAANSLFVDNVRDDGLISRDVYNLEQVEVYLGPTGSDVGRGNAAGYVNMTTKAPKLGASYSGNVSFGSAETKRVTVDLNQPLATTSDGWLSGSAIRLNALWQDAGVPGRQYANNERKAFAPSIGLGLGTPTRVTVAGQFTRQDNLPDYGIPGAAWSSPLAPASVLATQPVDQTLYYGSPDYDYDRADQDSITGRIEHDFTGGWTLRNQTRYNNTHRDAVITSIGNPAAFNAATQMVSYSRQVNVRDNKITSNQTSLTGRAVTGRVTHALSFGVDFINEDYSAPGMAGAGTRAPSSIYDPNPSAPITGFAIAPSGATTEGQTATQAVSFFDVMNIGSRLQVSAGYRAERYKTDFHSVATTGVVTDITAEDTVHSGKLGALVQVAPSGNVYISYGTAATPPGSGNFTLSAQANNANNPNVDPQISRNLEVGTKWDVFRRRLSLNLAVFDTRNTNVIYTIDATAVPPLFNQDDAQIVQGATIGLVGQPNDRFSILANLAYLDGKQDSQNPANDNRILTLMPKWSGSVWLSYALPVRVTLAGGVRFTDEVYVNTANTIVVPGHQIVDAMASYAINSNLTLRANFYNLFDEVYIRSVSNNGGRYNPGLSRSVLVNLQFGF